MGVARAHQKSMLPDLKQMPLLGGWLHYDSTCHKFLIEFSSSNIAYLLATEISRCVPFSGDPIHIVSAPLGSILFVFGKSTQYRPVKFQGRLSLS